MPAGSEPVTSPSPTPRKLSRPIPNPIPMARYRRHLAISGYLARRLASDAIILSFGGQMGLRSIQHSSANYRRSDPDSYAGTGTRKLTTCKEKEAADRIGPRGRESCSDQRPRGESVAQGSGPRGL